MSQIILTQMTIPSSVATIFRADDATQAVPVANILNVFSRQTSDDADFGIQTTADPNGSQNFYIELTNRLTGTVTTTDGTLTTIATLPMGTTASVIYLSGNVQAFNASTPAGGGYSFTGAFRNTGGGGSVAVEIGVEFKDQFEELALEPSEVFLIASGNDIVLQVQGVVGLSVNWNSLITYRKQ